MGEKFDWGSHKISDEVILAGSAVNTPREEADLLCDKAARKHYENFLVISRFTRSDLQQDMAALYAYSRYADDLADEGPYLPEERLRLLDTWENMLNEVSENAWTGKARHPIFVSLANTAQKHDLPVKPFRDLIRAFKLDQTKTRYNTWKEVTEYCQGSANPVGRIVLMLHGVRNEEAFAYSDDICTALQLANHWQDMRRDVRNGRIYMPLSTLSKHNANIEDIESLNLTQEIQNAVSYEVKRAEDLFQRGRSLLQLVDPYLSVSLDLFAAGGERILEQIRRKQYDTINQRVRIGRIGRFRLLFRGWRNLRKVERKKIHRK